MGVLAAVTLSRIAFPNSLYHEKMIERFSSLTTIITVEKKQKIIYIISITAASLSEYISVKWMDFLMRRANHSLKQVRLYILSTNG